MLQEHQVVNQQKYKMRQDRWSAAMIVILFLFYNPFFSSSNCNDLKMAILVYTVETDGKHGYSEGKPPLVQSNPLCLDFWWPHPFESTGTVHVGNEAVGDCRYELCECQSHVNEMKIFFFLNFCFTINTLQLMSCSPWSLTGRTEPSCVGCEGFQSVSWQRGGPEHSASNFRFLDLLPWLQIRTFAS